jgi:pimeloyl-ACP methyl ester carboxylesterase
MLIKQRKVCGLFASLVMLLFFSCNNRSRTESDNTLKTDTMNTRTLEKEPQLQTSIKGAAGNLFVSDGGAGGIPVVFIHAFGGSTQQWENQLEHLRSNRRAIAFDLRGHGHSETPANNDYDVELLANDIAAVVNGLKLDSFILVGHSMGGSAAIAYASKHQEKVRGLLLTGTPGKTPAEQSKQVIGSLESEKYDAVMEDYMKKLLANATPATDKSERDGMNKISKEGSISLIKALFKYDPLPDLRNYPGPKLIVSRSNEEQPNSLHIAFPNILYKMVEGTSHWIQMDKPEEFNKILDDFLKTIDEKNN